MGKFSLFYTVFIFSLAFSPTTIHAMNWAQKPVRPKIFYARYHDLGAPIKVRHVPTKQEVLEYDIQNFLQAKLLAHSLAQHRPSNAQCAAQRTALFARTLMHGTAQQATALLAANADPNNFDTPENAGTPPLHVAAHYTNIPVLQFLVAAKADIQAPDNQGNTVLHVAVHKENPALVCTLLAAGAQPESRDQNGLTALEYLENRKREYAHMREQIIRDNQKFECENNGEQLPTFRAVMQNLQDKLDTLYTICAALEKVEEKN